MDKEIESKNLTVQSRNSKFFESEFLKRPADSLPLKLINDLFTSKSENHFLLLLAQFAESLYPDHMRSIIFKVAENSEILIRATSPTLPITDNSPNSAFPLSISATGTPTGRAVYFRKAIFCSDITKDEAFRPYIARSKELDIKSCWSLPIFSSKNEVLGAFTFYFDEVMLSPPGIPELVQGLINLAGLGMERLKIQDEQNNTMKDLKTSRDRLSLALQARRMGVWDIELPATKVLFDDALLELFGITRKLFENKKDSWYNLIFEEDRAKVAREFNFAKENRSTFDTSFRVLRHGQIRYLHSAAAFQYDDQGNAIRVNGVNWDITERILAQQKLEAERAKSVANAKMASLGEMASSIAHEINNPLTIILNRANQLREKIENNKITPTLAADELVVIEDTVERIAKIIRGLTAFSRNAESDPFIECDIRSIVADAFELCRERFVKAGIEIRLFEISDDLLINGRPSQISQVLVNLLNNSFDAVSALNEKWLAIHVRENDGVIEISVVDSGHGIPDVVAEKIMDPFFTTKEVGRGTGLGLSISKGIIEEHRGRLFYDKASANTRFVILLPKSN